MQRLRKDLPEEDVSNGCSITLATSHNRSKKPTLMPSVAMICYGKRAYTNTWKNSRPSWPERSPQFWNDC